MKNIHHSSQVPALVFLLILSTASADEISHQVTAIPSKVQRVTCLTALPESQDGSQTNQAPKFMRATIDASEGMVQVPLSTEPSILIEGELPVEKRLRAADSPFGFHPASAPGIGYSYAEDIGVSWDRGGLYLMWVLLQPDLSKPSDWGMSDRYFASLPPGILPLKNITIAHDGMVQVPNRRKPPRRPGKKSLDVSSYLDGTSYRPKDPKAYSLWVRSAVERYDGDGVDDMPGLRNPAKHWQVDNEPPRLRSGYSDLVLVTSAAIKQADPQSMVLIGGLELPCGEERKVRNYHRTQAPILEELNG